MRPIIPLHTDLAWRCVGHWSFDRSPLLVAALSLPVPPHHTSFQGEIPKGGRSPAMLLEEHSMHHPPSHPFTGAHHGGQAPASCAHANIGSPPGVPLTFTISVSSFLCPGIWVCSGHPLQPLFSENLFILGLTMYLFGNKINIWTHQSIWLVFSVRGGVSISPSCGKSAAAVLSHYRTSLYSIKKIVLLCLTKLSSSPTHPPKPDLWFQCLLP